MAKALTVEEIATRAETRQLLQQAKEYTNRFSGHAVEQSQIVQYAEAWQSGWRPQALVEGK